VSKYLYVDGLYINYIVNMINIIYEDKLDGGKMIQGGEMLDKNVQKVGDYSKKGIYTQDSSRSNKDGRRNSGSVNTNRQRSASAGLGGLYGDSSVYSRPSAGLQGLYNSDEVSRNKKSYDSTRKKQYGLLDKKSNKGLYGVDGSRKVNGKLIESRNYEVNSNSRVSVDRRVSVDSRLPVDSEYLWVVN